ncbi:hypothetical protein ASPCADRAFT_212449, partial [Aspergillus carbonarius ITEM 5010]
MEGICGSATQRRQPTKCSPSCFPLQVPGIRPIFAGLPSTFFSSHRQFRNPSFHASLSSLSLRFWEHNGCCRWLISG